MPSSPIPVQVISGFLGAGKTTLIKQLLSCQPRATKVAVVINEFATLGLDGDQLAPFANTHAIRQIAGGCICCTSAPLLRTAIVRLIREEAPDLILIEPTGLGTPADIQKILHSQGLADHLNVHAPICLVAIPALTDDRYLSHEVFQAQLASAASVILTQGMANTASLAQLHTLCPQHPQYLLAPTIESLQPIAANLCKQLQPGQADTNTPTTPLPALPPLQLRPSSEITPNQWCIEQSEAGIAASYLSTQHYQPSSAAALAAALLAHLNTDPSLLRAKGKLALGAANHLDWQFANQRLDWYLVETQHPTQMVLITNTDTNAATLQAFCQRLIARLASFA